MIRLHSTPMFNVDLRNLFLSFPPSPALNVGAGYWFVKANLSLPMVGQAHAHVFYKKTRRLSELISGHGTDNDTYNDKCISLSQSWGLIHTNIAAVWFLIYCTYSTFKSLPHKDVGKFLTFTANNPLSRE